MNVWVHAGALALLLPLAGLVQAQPVGGSTYQLKRGDECIAGASPGTAVGLAACVGSAAGTPQAFTLVAAAGGTFSVQNVSNGEVFDISGAGTGEGSELITWPANGQDNQRFAIAARSAGVFDLRPQHASTMCVAAQTDDSVKLATCATGAVEQDWTLVEVEVVPVEPNRDCTASELYTPRFVENLQGGPRGSNAVIMTGGYMMVLFANDSGGPPGILHFYDVADPRQPVLLGRIDDTNTARFREAHSLPVALIGDKEYVAIQTVDGIQFWDLSEPHTASYVSRIDLPGVSGGDYDNVAWQADWHGRNLYVAGSNQGLYVIDAHDPTDPQLLTQVPTGQMGGFRIGPLMGRGSYLVVGNMDQDGAYSVLDVSRPDQPALLGTIDGLPRLYSMTATGNRIYGAGRDGDFTIHSFEDPTSIMPISSTRIEQDSLYVAAQDHFVFSGRQENFVKLDVSNEQDVQIVGEGTVGRTNTDHGQVTPMGNWVFIGNDHGTGSAFFCHAQTDELPLAVQTIFPSEDSTHQDPQSTITIVFSDYVDTRTVDSSTVAIRPSGGEPLTGIYTYNFNTLSFSPDAPFEANTTYEIAMPVGGIKDVSGNPLATEVIARFSTGDSIVIVTPPPEMDAGSTGGTGGTGGAGGTTGTPDAGGAPLPDTGVGTGAPVDNGGLRRVDGDDRGCSVVAGRREQPSTPASWWLIAAAALLLRRSRPRRV